MIVVAIIGILAAIAIPQFSSYRQKAERATIISDCRMLYGSFVMWFLEDTEYPAKDAGFYNSFNPTTLAPLPLQRDYTIFLSKMVGNKADAYDAPDGTLGINQEFYVIFRWANDPDIRFVISSANFVYPDGSAEPDPEPAGGDASAFENGSWLDGVYTFDEMDMVGG